MKRILLPTDFSENALNAIRYAMAFFKEIPCEFYFLNVQKPSEYVTGEIYTASPTKSTIYESVSKDNQEKLHELVTQFRKEYEQEPFSFDSIFDFDVFVDAIQQVVNTRSIELIIMGTNGATDAAEVLFGSNTLKVIRNVNCPILAIPEGFQYQQFASVLFTYKKEDEFHPDALKPLGDLINGKTVSLEVLCIDNHKELPKSNVLDLFSEVHYHEVDGVPTPEAVNSYEQLLPVDMHTIFVKPKSFFQRIFSGSDVPKISYESKVPLLVLK